MFAGRVEAEGIRRGAGHVRQLTDPRRRGRLDLEHRHARFPEATEIADLFHAREHLHDLARLLEFMLGDHRQDWLAARLEDLDHGDIDGICDAARVYPLAGVKKGELDTALGYFENNAPPARATSGSAPAACSSAPEQSNPGAKRSSASASSSPACTTVARASAIATLRCQQASRPEDQICHAPRNQTSAA